MVTESRRRTSNLLVSKVNKKDAGNYTCVPSNARADSVMVHVIDGMFTMYKEKNGTIEFGIRILYLDLDHQATCLSILLL